MLSNEGENDTGTRGWGLKHEFVSMWVIVRACVSAPHSRGCWEKGRTIVQLHQHANMTM